MNFWRYFASIAGFGERARASSPATSSSLAEQARREIQNYTEEDSEELDGGKYMQPTAFQQVARRIAALDRRVEWSVIRGGTASGRLGGASEGQRYECRLRPLRNQRVEGIVFVTLLMPPPPAESQQRLFVTAQAINGAIYPHSGATVGWQANSGEVHFTTATFRGPDGYTDEKLLILTDLNIRAGVVIAEALVGVHQNRLSPDHATSKVLNFYNQYWLQAQ